MRRILSAALALALIFTGCSDKGKVRPVKNVIFMIVDGCSEGSLSVARWYKQYTENTDECLALDPYICGVMRMAHVNGAVVGSAGSMTTLMTGQRVTSGSICVYPKPHPDNDMFELDTARAISPLANVADVAVRELGKKTGIVVTTTFCHATPAATIAHAYSRSDYGQIAAQMASSAPDVVLGGGVRYVTPKMRDILSSKGIKLLTDDPEGYADFDGDRLWSLMGKKNMNYDCERDPGEPSLAQMTSRALKMLDRNNRKGFFLMVEGSQLDFAAHAGDPCGIVSEILGFDDAVRVALDFARKDGNTAVVICTDHGNSGIQLGRQDYTAYGSSHISKMLGGLPGYKSSSFKMADRLLGCNTPERVRELFREYEGLELTDEEVESIVNVADVTESDYMEIGATRNLQCAVAKILSSHVIMSYSSSRHTGEDVFYAIYNPRGQRPEGYIENVDMNAYLCSLMGFRKSMEEYSDEYFAKAAEIFPDAAETADSYGDPALEVTLTDGRKAVFSSGSSFVNVDGKTVDMGVPVVYIVKNRTFWLPRDVESRL